MCRKLYEYISNDHWGIHVTVYQGEKVYCFVVADRDGTNYYLVDFEFNRFYPVTSQAVRTASAHEDRSHDEIVARLLDLDLSKFGSGKCAPHARSFAKQMQEDLAAGIKVKFSPPRKQRRIWDYFRTKCKKK